MGDGDVGGWVGGWGGCTSEDSWAITISLRGVERTVGTAVKSSRYFSMAASTTLVSLPRVRPMPTCIGRKKRVEEKA